ncbi:hypothetical protein ACFU6R_04955 [Streptomyces sp. NPDC057499]
MNSALPTIIVVIFLVALVAWIVSAVVGGGKGKGSGGGGGS